MNTIITIIRAVKDALGQLKTKLAKPDTANTGPRPIEDYEYFLI